MSRRVVFGKMPDGTIDFRVARRGYDAGTANKDDGAQISFAASRGNSRIVAAVSVLARDTTYSIGSWPTEPPVWLGYNDGGYQFLDDYKIYPNGAMNYRGTTFVAVVTTSTVKIVKGASYSGGSDVTMPPANIVAVQ